MNKSEYWENIVGKYQQETKISCDDFHYGPLIYGDSVLKLLPDNLKDLTCLEIACGGAQNSICLASHGAECTALDASEAQISYAEKLAQENSVDIDLKLMAMEEISPQIGSFDLIHSAYGFNFADNFDNLISNVFELLNDNGILLFSMPHPLFSGEFLELEDEDGLFIKEYLDIEPERRYDEDGSETTCSYFYSLDYISYILSKNGFLIERLCEPEVCENPPYTSELWEEYREQMSRFPGTIIIKAIKK